MYRRPVRRRVLLLLDRAVVTGERHHLLVGRRGTVDLQRRAQIAEVRRRIAEVESGEVALVPGEQALDQVRRVVAAARLAR